MPLGIFSAEGTNAYKFTGNCDSAAALAVANTAIPPVLSNFICSIFCAGFMLIPPESNVIALPTRATVGSFFAAPLFGVYLTTINLGGVFEPYSLLALINGLVVSLLIRLYGTRVVCVDQDRDASAVTPRETFFRS